MGRVTDKDTGQPIVTPRCFVRISKYDKTHTEKTLRETRQKTDSDGRYRFSIAPEQLAKPWLFIYLDVNHPGYVFYYGANGYGPIARNEKVGARPFFEDYCAPAGHVGRGPAGESGRYARRRGPDQCLLHEPGMKRKDPNEWGAFTWTSTDADGRFRLDLFPSGPAVFWVVPENMPCRPTS